ncbi:L-aspartate oxidase [Flavobacterium longum]|uniref:L-aspartate oxidase n=1 Tax=Flavobacterium longum TaxID=1299340 RepID=UPI0039E95A49
MNKADYLIIGSGIAGLTLAIRLAERFPDRAIVIVTKANEEDSNTQYAQGGIAIVLDDTTDSYEKHIRDTLICGDGLCDESVVRMVVTDGPKRFRELLDWGARFDRGGYGHFDLGKEGGHSESRVLHHKDQTGAEIERAILAKVRQLENITVLDHFFAVDVVMCDGSCIGVTVLHEKTSELVQLYAGFTILATGGIGQVYGHTTNPLIATGDGVAMAHRANAQILDMEFIQFHPTAFYEKKAGAAFLISEAVRGFGALLKTKEGRRFMPDYDSRGELASRDIVSQSIHAELEKTGDDCVYLDCTHLNHEKFMAHFPMIHRYCMDHGVDIRKDWIPVLPAQHYLCGGIVVDEHGRTSIDGLLACGECSRTGLHGANRLASNSLLEALVYSHQIYAYLERQMPKPYGVPPKTTRIAKPTVNALFVTGYRRKLHELMLRHVGIVRRDSGLALAANSIAQWEKEITSLISTHAPSVALYETLNMLQVAGLIVSASRERTENRGGFVKIS